MCKKIWNKAFLGLCVFTLCLMASSCGDSAKASSGENAETASKRVISTTKTAQYAEKVDNDDEDFEGYTTKASETAAPLENQSGLEELEGYDEGIRATMTTKTTTVYASSFGSSEMNKNKETTTAFKSDSLYPLSYGEEFESTKTFKVVSDTTYLNLRFGPSINYNVQLKIPNGKIIKGLGEDRDSSGGRWIYVTYNGTSGWVMNNLLQEQ